MCTGSAGINPVKSENFPRELILFLNSSRWTGQTQPELRAPGKLLGNSRTQARLPVDSLTDPELPPFASGPQSPHLYSVGLRAGFKPWPHPLVNYATLARFLNLPDFHCIYKMEIR